MTGFYSHRKTMRLLSKLGHDAFWIPPRLWVYCAENQPDGNLSGYDAVELALLIGYNKDATSMLQALKDCGFMDSDGTIHDWKEYNGYHERYSERAKTAAAARWSKEKPPHTPQKKVQRKRKEESGDKHCLEHACSIPSLSEVLEAWNSKEKLGQCLLISPKRKISLEARFRESFFLENWKSALEKVSTSEFCLGSNDRGWKASFDWFISPDAVVKIMEGKYDHRKSNSTQSLNPAADRRNAGTYGGTDYGKAAARRLAEQDEKYKAYGMGEGEAANAASPPATTRLNPKTE